jgi:hypothetical protein
MGEHDAIDLWGVVQLYTAATRKESWIEAISVGYTLLETQLHYLARSKAGPAGVPIAEDTLAKCRYLMDVAALTRDEGFLPSEIFENLSAFNAARIRAIHKLSSGAVTPAELRAAADDVLPLYGSIQGLWLKVTVGPAVRV